MSVAWVFYIKNKDFFILSLAFSHWEVIAHPISKEPFTSFIAWLCRWIVFLHKHHKITLNVCTAQKKEQLFLCFFTFLSKNAFTMSTIAPTLHSRPLRPSSLVCPEILFSVSFLPDKGLWEEYEKTDLKVRGAEGEGGGSGGLYYNSSPATFRYFAFYQLEEEGFTI